MSERDGFESGVPCWVSHVSADPSKAVAFYRELFGWETENPMPADHPGDYFVCRLRGRDVAAVVSTHGTPAPPAATWTTHIWVDGADQAAAKVSEAGGKVIGEPFDSPGGGRMAVVADPAGAVFSVWQPTERRGAQLVNEPGAWAMSALNTRDPDGAKDFYANVFGWTSETFDLGDTQVTMLKLPGYVGGEPQQPVARDVVATIAPIDGPPDDVPPHWSVDFWVPNAGEAAGRAAELGGAVIAPPYEIPDVGLRQAVLADDQGAGFSVTQPPGI